MNNHRIGVLHPRVAELLRGAGMNHLTPLQTFICQSALLELQATIKLQFLTQITVITTEVQYIYIYTVISVKTMDMDLRNENLKPVIIKPDTQVNSENLLL